MVSQANDRSITERVVLPALLQVVARGIADMLKDQPALDFSEPIKLLDAAVHEPLTGLPPDRRAKLGLRGKRVTSAACRPLVGHSLVVQYLGVAYMIQELVARDVVTVGQDSDFARAWDMLAEVMLVIEDRINENDAAGREVASRIAGVLAAEGLFR